MWAWLTPVCPTPPYLSRMMIQSMDFPLSSREDGLFFISWVCPVLLRLLPSIPHLRHKGKSGCLCAGFFYSAGIVRFLAFHSRGRQGKTFRQNRITNTMASKRSFVLGKTHTQSETPPSLLAQANNPKAFCIGEMLPPFIPSHKESTAINMHMRCSLWSESGGLCSFLK